MADVLGNNEIDEKLKQLDGWENSNGKKISKKFKFKNFKQALEFTNKVGEIAEDKQHHPDIHLSWGKVVVDITNHEAGGVTESDYELAEEIEKIS